MHFNQLCAKSFNLIFKVPLEPRQRSNQRCDEGAADDCPVSSFSEPRTSPFFPSYSRNVVLKVPYLRHNLDTNLRQIKDAMTVQQMINHTHAIIIYRGSATYTKISNTVSTTTFFGLCTCKWGN